MKKEAKESLTILLIFGIVFGVGFWFGYKWPLEWGPSEPKKPKMMINSVDKLKKEKYKVAFRKTVEIVQKVHKVNKVEFDRLVEENNGNIGCHVQWGRPIIKGVYLEKGFSAYYDSELSLLSYHYFYFQKPEEQAPK